MKLYYDYLAQEAIDDRLCAEMEAEAEAEELRLQYDLMTDEERDTYEREVGRIPCDW